MAVCENGWMRNFLPDFVKRLQPETQRKVYKYVDDLTRTLESMARQPELSRTPFTARAIKALQTRGASQTLTPWYDDAAVIDGCTDYNDLVLFEKHTNTSMNEFLSPSDLNWFANAGLLVTHFPTLVDTLLGNNGTSLLPGEATILLTDADCGGTEQPEDDADNEPPDQAEDAL